MGGNIDQIKERLDITELISGYVKLQKAGASFKACCPFHNEKTPSFFVSPARQSFYCFGCGAKGDIFSFVERMEGMDFREALKHLAEKAGIELEYESPKSKEETKELFDVLEEATMFFEKEFGQNKVAQKYLTSRGISPETISAWRIGYAPHSASGDWRRLYNHLLESGFKKETIIRAGLAKINPEKKEREPYDVFRDRIVFPLFDSRGRPVAFSGRALSKETEPKYLNSPDTLLFNKSRLLYGLDKAKDYIRRKNFAVLVEGQVDLVLSHQAGVENTVATSGTAFTAEHLESLRRFSSRIIIAFDGDDSGDKAAERASIVALSLGFEVKVARLPQDSDPADIIKDSPEKWKDVLRNSSPAIEHFFRLLQEKEKDQRRLGKEVEHKILPMIKLVESAIEQSHFVSFIARSTGISEEVITKDLNKINLGKPARPSSTSESRGETTESRRTRKEELEEVRSWLAQEPKNKDLLSQEEELSRLVRIDEIDEELRNLHPKSDSEEKKKFELIKERDSLRSQILPA